MRILDQKEKLDSVDDISWDNKEFCGQIKEKVNGINVVTIPLRRYRRYTIAYYQRKYFLLPVSKINCNKKGLSFPVSTATCQNDVLPPEFTFTHPSVHLRKKEENITVHNVFRCKSKTLCPLCRPVLLDAYGARLEKLRQECVGFGLKSLMVTFTMQHDGNQSLSDVLGMLKDAWRKMTSYTRWKQFRVHFFGYVYCLEITYGFPHGWHPHYHVLFFQYPEEDAFHGNLQYRSFADLYSDLDFLWSSALKRSGYTGDYIEYDLEEDFSTIKISEIHDASYLSKWGVGQELSSSQKSGKKRNRYTIFDLEHLLPDEFWVRPILKEYYKEISGKSIHHFSKYNQLFLDLKDQVFADYDEERILEQGDHEPIYCYVNAEVWRNMLNSGETQLFLRRLSMGYDPKQVVSFMGYEEDSIFYD